MKASLSDQELLNLTEEQVREIVPAGDPTTVWLVLRLQALARGKAKAPRSPSTPSSQIPPYEKANAEGKKKGGKRPGRKKGHKGERRSTPPHIDVTVEHVLKACPDCGAAVSEKKYGTISRIIEDIRQTTAEVVRHIIHTHYCPQCKKHVRPKVAAALPKSTLGLRTVLLGCWLHYATGQTLSQVVSVFDSLFHHSVTGGGLTQQWQRLGRIFEPWYEAIGDQARASAVLHGDETGWRQQGRTVWLWCFASTDAVFYQIDPSRSSRVVVEFLKDCFEGTLITDFYAAYNIMADDQRQVCLAHLLSELKKVGAINTETEWQAFSNLLKRLLRDAMRLASRTDRDAKDYLSKSERIKERLKFIYSAEYTDPDCRRLAKRLRRHERSMFIFLDNPLVPPDNNRAEREIRPAVIARKNSSHNMSENGAKTQAIFMSIYRTLKLRKLDPLETMIRATAQYIRTGKLSELPSRPDP
jgi:transposase